MQLLLLMWNSFKNGAIQIKITFYYMVKWKDNDSTKETKDLNLLQTKYHNTVHVHAWSPNWYRDPIPQNGSEQGILCVHNRERPTPVPKKLQWSANLINPNVIKNRCWNWALLSFMENISSFLLWWHQHINYQSAANCVYKLRNNFRNMLFSVKL